MSGTVIYPNRKLDYDMLKAYHGLPEFGNDIVTFIIDNKMFAEGYNRIVYGDHGPYIEFEVKHIKCKLINKFGNIHYPVVPTNPRYHYEWLCPEHNKNIKVYFQLKTVHNHPDAPQRTDGRPHKFNRAEGYADYKIGKIYVDPYEFKVGKILQIKED